MFSAFVLKTLASPRQILFGARFGTFAVVSLAFIAMLGTGSPLLAGMIVFALQPLNVWLTRRDAYWDKVFVMAFVPLLKQRLKTPKKERFDA